MDVLDFLAPFNPTEARLEVENIEEAEREILKSNPDYTPIFITK